MLQGRVTDRCDVRPWRKASDRCYDIPVATPLQTVDQLQEYFRGVIGRSEHHAQAVRDVLPLLAGVIIFHKDAGTPLEARTHSGAMAKFCG